MTVLVISYTYYKRQHHLTATHQADIKKAEAPVLNKVTYQLVQPSVGALQITVPVSITIIKDKAVLALTFAQADKVETGKKLILYDKNNHAWPYKGKIESISNGKATIVFPKDMPLLPNATTHKAALIISENILAKRLPNAALMTDESGKYWIWKAVRGQDGTFHIERIDIDAPDSNAEFFDVANGVRTDEFIIANPDLTLVEGASIPSVIAIASSAPTLDPQEEALQAADEDTTQDLVDRMPTRLPLSQSASCGDSTDPIENLAATTNPATSCPVQPAPELP